MILENGKFYAPGDNANADVALINATVLELLNYGYYLDFEVVGRLRQSSNAEELCYQLRKSYTDGRLNRPLFSNWERREYFSWSERAVQITGYFFQFSGNDFNSTSFIENLYSKVSINSFQRIELASDGEAKNYVRSLLESKLLLNKKQLDRVAEGVRYFDFSDVRFGNNEVKALVIDSVTRKGVDVYSALATFRANPHDVLRFAAVRANPEQVNLPNEVKYDNLSWQERKGLVNFINTLAQVDFEDVAEKMGLNRNAWLRFVRHFKVLKQDAFEKYPYALAAFYISQGYKYDAVRPSMRKFITNMVHSGSVETTAEGALAYRTFASRINTAVERRDYKTAMALLDTKPGYLLRNLQTIMRTVSSLHERDFIERVRLALKSTTVDNLFSLLRIGVNSEYRIIDANGLTTVQPASYPLVFNRIQELAKTEVRFRFGVLGTVVADPTVANRVPDVLSRNTQISRGSIIPLEKQDYLYVYMHWVQNRMRTDLDLSFVAFDANWNSSYVYFASQSNGYMRHSGDFTNAPAPEGATEYGQIDFNRIPKGVRYICPIINVYSGEAFDRLIESYAGFSLSDSSEFRLSQSTLRYDLKGNNQTNSPFVLDVWERKVIITDINLRESRGWTAHAYENDLAQIVKAILSQNTLTVGKIAELLSGPSTEVGLTITDNEHDPANHKISYTQLHEYFSPR